MESRKAKETNEKLWVLVDIVWILNKLQNCHASRPLVILVIKNLAVKQLCVESIN